jgi:hypothetical protein
LTEHEIAELETSYNEEHTPEKVREEKAAIAMLKKLREDKI